MEFYRNNRTFLVWRSWVSYMTHLDWKFVVYLRFKCNWDSCTSVCWSWNLSTPNTSTVNTAVGSLVELVHTEAKRKLKPSKAAFKILTRIHLLCQNLALLFLQFLCEASKEGASCLRKLMLFNKALVFNSFLPCLFVWKFFVLGFSDIPLSSKA